MTAFTTLLQQGNAWLFVPSAILLGALHGLEPGHSKTMMAAFIVAIRGTLGQAVLLGLSATISHTAVVWAVAMAGLYFGRNLNAETTEPYFQVASAVLIVAVAAWMMWRTWRSTHAEHDHDHAHDHDAGGHVESGDRGQGEGGKQGHHRDATDLEQHVERTRRESKRPMESVLQPLVRGRHVEAAEGGH